MSNDTVVFDLDGTLFNNSHRKHFADAGEWDKYHEASSDDVPNQKIIRLALSLSSYINIVNILILTERDEKYFSVTLNMLSNTELKDALDFLIMKPSENFEKTDVFKYNALLKHFGGNEDAMKDRIWFIVDDKDSTVEMFRNKGFTVLQPCAQGA